MRCRKYANYFINSSCSQSHLWGHLILNTLFLCHVCYRYWNEDITTHEFSHSLMLTGLTQVFPSFDAELTLLYKAAKASGSWGCCHYAMTNYEEYWAEAVQGHNTLE